ncbi:uncharacterized protein LOC130796046 [Actinidia eriantha]|uniref:uncharacterized protein LOC130796046 n=1 Tax=Actinidia eriantha TaxID=165200 RepID=UPI002588384F|nr:uncharacterized protein LOC130796046 [Actinidia eriantha]
MARARTTPPSTAVGSPKRLAIGLLDSVTHLWASCAKHATRVSRKIRAESTGPNSPLARPRRLLATISHKAIQFRYRKRASRDGGAAEEEEEEFVSDENGSLWQRTILMGDKCQPLDFSGVIYYDSKGNQLAELPMRSPRASPLPSYVYAKQRELE